MKEYSVLLIDDDPGILFSFSTFLKKSGFDVLTASTIVDAREKLKKEVFHAVILDVQLPDGSGIELIESLKEENPSQAIILVTGHGDVPMAVEAMQKGADHFLSKPVRLKELEVVLQKAIELSNLRVRHHSSKRLAKKSRPFFGSSPATIDLQKMITLASGQDLSVLLLGETGSGKGVLARWIHENSLRQNGSFVEVNCSGLRSEMMASELFGHKRGAFTSAVEDKQGLIEVADKGTLFLDEIGDMALDVQPQLLKAIEEKKFFRLGETKTRKSDFRMICATNQDLRQKISRGLFREDLFYRIETFPIHVPPLRKIQENIPDLAQVLLKEMNAPFDSLSQPVKEFLCNYPWPGNTRELKSILQRAVILSEGKPLSPEHFPGLNSGMSLSSYPNETIKTLDQLEQEYIRYVLKESGNDTLKASRLLGISRAALYRKLKK
jgi:DNA-binding NtrC family response regulator